MDWRAVVVCILCLRVSCFNLCETHNFSSHQFHMESNRPCLCYAVNLTLDRLEFWWWCVSLCVFIWTANQLPLLLLVLFLHSSHFYLPQSPSLTRSASPVYRYMQVCTVLCVWGIYCHTPTEKFRIVVIIVVVTVVVAGVVVEPLSTAKIRGWNKTHFISSQSVKCIHC